MKYLLNICFIYLLIALAAPLVNAKEIYLLRHAEKQTGNNPSLTAEGKARAERLKSKLAALNPKVILSTPYNRTIETVTPLANALKLSISQYNPRSNNRLFELVNNNDGITVIVGHSNTIPLLVEHFSGEKVKISEKEFNHLFHITDGKLKILNSD